MITGENTSLQNFYSTTNIHDCEKQLFVTFWACYKTISPWLQTKDKQVFPMLIGSGFSLEPTF